MWRGTNNQHLWQILRRENDFLSQLRAPQFDLSILSREVVMKRTL